MSGKRAKAARRVETWRDIEIKLLNDVLFYKGALAQILYAEEADLKDVVEQVRRQVDAYQNPET